MLSDNNTTPTLILYCFLKCLLLLQHILTIFFYDILLFSYLGYAKAGKKLFEMAKNSWDEHKEPYPIWGTCLGFELLALLGKLSILKKRK